MSMTRSHRWRQAALAVVLAAALAGCSSGSSSPDAPSTRDLTLRVLPALTPSGTCSGSPVSVGIPVRLTDADGEELAVATAAATPGAEGCDVSARFDGVATSPSYGVEAPPGRPLATFDADQVVAGEVTLKVSTDGTVSVVE